MKRSEILPNRFLSPDSGDRWIGTRLGGGRPPDPSAPGWGERGGDAQGGGSGDQKGGPLGPKKNNFFNLIEYERIPFKTAMSLGSKAFSSPFPADILTRMVLIYIKYRNARVFGEISSFLFCYEALMRFVKHHSIYQIFLMQKCI